MELIVFYDRETIIEALREEITALNNNILFLPLEASSIEEIERQQDLKVLIFFDGRRPIPEYAALVDIASKKFNNLWFVLIGKVPYETVEELKMLVDVVVIDMEQNSRDDIKNYILKFVYKSEIVFPLAPPESPNLSHFDALINTLVDGNEEQRSKLLHHIQTNKTLDRQGFSTRLRHEIIFNFSPDKEDNFATAIRDPKKMSSVRSWMLSALIWTDVEENRGLILDHLDEDIEPDENVRYWTLAGLFQRKASYLEEVAKKASKMYYSWSVFENLAKAILPEQRENALYFFREQLHNPTLDSVWMVLRVLRIVPIPELAPDVCEVLHKEEDSSTMAYDAFYALANPEMAKAAAEILSANPGAGKIVDRIINVARGSTTNTIRNFSGMLTVFNRPEVDTALIAARSNPEKRMVADQLRRHLDEYSLNGESQHLSLAGYASDTIDVKDDRLDIREDVQALTAIMIAQEVTPPLAIGLFGDWGTGKSFFMQSIKAEVKRLQTVNQNNPASRYCHHIVQIDFNAWHYVDTNLWASLVSFIFEKLAAHVSPQQNTEEKHKQLVAKLDDAKVNLEKTEIEKQGMKEQIQVKQAELELLQTARKEKEISYSDLGVKDFHDLLTKEQKEELHNLLDEIGVPPALRNIEDLNNVVSEAYTVRGRIVALFLSIFNSKNWRWLVLLLVLILGVIPGIIWYVRTQLDITGFWVNVAAVISQVSVFIGTVTAVIGKALKTVNTSLKQVEATKKRIEDKIAEKQSEETLKEKELAKEIEALKEKVKQADNNISTAAKQVATLEKQIETFNEENSLNKFLADRNLSEDYRKHLGLISTIRRDFESLIDRLDYARKRHMDKYQPVDRIILYIDDLDRCPTSKVMEVLQAVHLLLAYPLFVVVVGVDPRWLLHSLSSTFTAFKNEGKTQTIDGEQWNTTPQNFLEKIFQIPFSLRPMTSNGFGKLMDGLMLPVSAEITLPTVEQIVITEKVPLEIPLAPGEKPVIHEMKPKVEKEHIELKEPIEPPPPPTFIAERSLIIKEWESRFAGDLFALIPTPRAAKRFSNIYRILKASVREEEIEAFEGTAELPGSFQVPMVLLAILIHSPAIAAELFPQLQENGTLAKLAEEEKLQSIVNSHFFPDDPELYRKWLPKVSRFSFELGRLEFKK